MKFSGRLWKCLISLKTSEIWKLLFQLCKYKKRTENLCWRSLLPKSSTYVLSILYEL